MFSTAQETGSPMTLCAAPLASFDIVFSKEGYFISLNANCTLSSCESYRLDENHCLILQEGAAEIVTAPVPPEFRHLVSLSKSILFVRLVNGEIADKAKLPRVGGVW